MSYSSPPTLPPGNDYANEQDETLIEDAKVMEEYKKFADANGLFFDPVKNAWVAK